MTDPLAEPAGYGVKIDQTPRPNWNGHDTHWQCDIWRSEHCPNRRTHIIWIGCLNEHVGPVCICDQHPDIELVLAALRCKFCLDAGETQHMHVIRKDPAP